MGRPCRGIAEGCDLTEARADREYHALREQIEGILSEGKIHTRQAGEWERVETYWHIGDALQTHFRGHPRARYRQQIALNLRNNMNLG